MFNTVHCSENTKRLSTTQYLEKMTIFIIKLYIVHRNKAEHSLRLNCILLTLPLCPAASHTDVEKSDRGMRNKGH